MAVAKIGELAYDTLSAAITAANAMENGATITLTSDIEFNAALTISKNITLEGYHTITRASNYTKTFMTISSGVTFTLKNVTIDSNHDWSFDMDRYNEYADNGIRTSDSTIFVTVEEGAPKSSAYMFVVKGNMIIDDGVIIQNNYGTGLFSVSSGGTLTTNNCTFTHIYGISNNTIASIGGGGIWIINDGTLIAGNHGSGNGGMCRSDGHIIMNGGVIEYNTAVNSNGTVFMFYGAGSYFEMNSGIIRGNKGVYGSSNGRCAAVYMHTKSTMVMNNGLIEVNTGNSCGGIDAPYTTSSNGSTVTINGGSVTNNYSVMNQDYIDIRGDVAVVITGGTFTQDVSQ